MIEIHLPFGHPWAELIEQHEILSSTNDRAKELARDGAPEGTVVISEAQTAGRGRLGRSFHSPGGSGLYLSVILRPGCPPARLMHLTCAAAVAASNAIEDATGFRPGIKWINDLVADGKKLGGILTELSIDPQTGLVDWAIVGVGINCSHWAGDFPQELQCIACSLTQVTGQAVDRGRLATAMLLRLRQIRIILLSQQADIMARYRQHCVTLGRPVTVICGKEQRSAVALDVDSDGALLVDFGDGCPQAVNSGEVSVRGLFGYT